MARTPMVTRTITTTEATVLCLNINTGEPMTVVCTVPRTYKDEEALLKAVKAVEENECVKCVHVVDSRTIETLYGMTEQEFINTAKVLPPRTEKETEE